MELSKVSTDFALKMRQYCTANSLGGLDKNCYLKVMYLKIWLGLLSETKGMLIGLTGRDIHGH